ncbi:MAG: hypothetical protein IJH13_01620 [Bacilli bacterium]|nr:hypothetical protein [Bacilli bacterium]
MKKIFSIHNVFLMLVVVLIGVLSLNTKEAKAAGTVTWSGPNSITIRETIHNIAGPITAYREYYLYEYFGSYNQAATATINYTASDTITNYQQTKSTIMNLSTLTFTKPGDYKYFIDYDNLYDSNDRNIDYFAYFHAEEPLYIATVSVRNVLDENGVPTGNFTATLILEVCTHNEQTDEDECTKVNPSSGTLYADYDYGARPNKFGYIELSKTVTGIGADTTKYFPFTININNDPTTGTYTYPLDTSGWTYPITGIDASVTYNGNTINNPTTITVGTPTTIYLKHGQTAIIGQVTSGGNTFDAIPIGRCQGTYNTNPDSGGSGGGITSAYDYSKIPNAKKLASIDGGTCYGSYYTIEEDRGDYAPEFRVGSGSLESGYYVYAKGINNGTNSVEFLNNKEMSPVTGLIFTILPYVILIGVGVGGTLLFMSLKKKKTNKV